MLFRSPVAYATAHVAAMFVKFFPRDMDGIYAPEALPTDARRAILAGVKKHGVKITHKMTALKADVDDEEEGL